MSYSNEIIPVKLSDGTVIQIEATHQGGEEDVAFDIKPFSDVAKGIEGLVENITGILKKLKPDTASVEFGVDVGIESGKLTALMVKGSGKANMKIVMQWNNRNSS